MIKVELDTFRKNQSKMDSIQIKKVSLSDIRKLQKLGRETFFETFAESNSADNMKMYLEEAFSDRKLRSELENPNSKFYFAESEGEPIGYLKVNFGDSQTEQKKASSFEIERIYVLKDYHGKTVGQLLFEKAIQLAHEKQVDFVWLGVWEKNPRAISFYKKNGFAEFGRHIFKLGDDEQTDIMMKLELL